MKLKPSDIPSILGLRRYDLHAVWERMTGRATPREWTWADDKREAIRKALIGHYQDIKLSRSSFKLYRRGLLSSVVDIHNGTALLTRVAVGNGECVKWAQRQDGWDSWADGFYYEAQAAMYLTGLQTATWLVDARGTFVVVEVPRDDDAVQEYVVEAAAEFMPWVERNEVPPKALGQIDINTLDDVASVLEHDIE